MSSLGSSRPAYSRPSHTAQERGFGLGRSSAWHQILHSEAAAGDRALDKLARQYTLRIAAAQAKRNRLAACRLELADAWVKQEECGASNASRPPVDGSRRRAAHSRALPRHHSCLRRTTSTNVDAGLATHSLRRALALSHRFVLCVPCDFATCLLQPTSIALPLINACPPNPLVHHYTRIHRRPVKSDDNRPRNTPKLGRW